MRTIGTRNKAKWRQAPRRRERSYTPIPLLALQIAVFNSSPTREHKDALAILRASIADRVYQASFKRRERL